MDELRVAFRPELKKPVLVAAFRGWNDGGQAASMAGGYLAKQWAAARFADIDPENFYDFQVTRPQVSLVDGLTRKLDWPDNAFYHAHLAGAGRDAVVFLGIEPNIRWRTFTQLIVGLAADLEVEMVITLGALLADVPHTRPAPVTGSASDPKLVDELGLQASRYEGPTGIVGVLHDACRALGLPSVMLWAAVPHYVSLAPSPRGALALCQRLGQMLDIPIETGELEEASERYAEQVSEAVSSDADTAAYVEELEQRVDTIEELDIPSGDSLAAELTRFLREREEGNGDSAGDAARDQ
jgi:proteasome assembly chaperone (PAC2) family protein